MIPAFWSWLLVAAVSATTGAGLSYRFTADSYQARIARIEATHAAEKQAAAEGAARRLAAAQEAERAALHALHATKNTLAATRKKLKETLHALPTADRCGLSGPARGLLNRALDATASLPAHPAEPAPAPAAPAADPGAGEGDVGGWIADAIAQYNECRARIDALRQWDAAISTP